MRLTLLTTAEAAERLGVTERRVRQYCDRGQLPAVRFGERWAIAEKDVATYRRQAGGRPRKEKP